MSVQSSPIDLFAVPSEKMQSLRACLSWWNVFAVGLLVLLTVGLRSWNLGATFETSDQAAMPHMICTFYGVDWIFAHDYGPVLPAIHKVWATAWCGVGGVYDETAARLPVAVMGMLLVGMSYLLVRRLHMPRSVAWIAAMCMTVVPALVVDSRYAWGDHGVWVLLGATSLWCMLSYLDTRRGIYLAAGAVSLFAHCLSSLYAFALPLALMAAWWMAYRHEHTSRKRDAGRVPLKHALIGYVLPCILALIVIFVSWQKTGGGQIGHLLEKGDVGTYGLHVEQIPALPAMWLGQFSFVFGLVTAGAMLWAAAALVRGKRIGLLGIWAWMGLLPFVLIADWNSTGYAQYFMFEVVYAASLLGVLGLCRLWEHWSRHRWAVGLIGALAFLQLSLASLDVILPHNQLSRFTGVQTGWGDVRPDSGVKAAGAYVRAYVPIDATIMTLHTNEGMEVPVAEYYLGRKVLAHYDLLPEAVAPLWEAMREDVDVVIVEPEDEHLVSRLPEWERVYTATRHDVPVRQVYARRSAGLERLVEDVVIANARYDATIHASRVPFELAVPTGFLEKLERYQRTIRELRAMRFESTFPGM